MNSHVMFSGTATSNMLSRGSKNTPKLHIFQFIARNRENYRVCRKV